VFATVPTVLVQAGIALLPDEHWLVVKEVLQN